MRTSARTLVVLDEVGRKLGERTVAAAGGREWSGVEVDVVSAEAEDLAAPRAVNNEQHERVGPFGSHHHPTFDFDVGALLPAVEMLEGYNKEPRQPNACGQAE
jgi:hypothetical protein